ncbi:hypothetical protein ABVK25_012535 [Lepraria finkii]|uniref:Uncharacterized protein n=1 Tax=Lepraria finkii TaxID=1340010 RepID=A0ABR4AG64_9LECA
MLSSPELRQGPGKFPTRHRRSLTELITRFSPIADFPTSFLSLSNDCRSVWQASHKCPTITEVFDPAQPVAVNSPVKSRHTPLDLNGALHKCYEWATKIESGSPISKRDEKRGREAFDLVAQKDKGNPYYAFLMEAEQAGGGEPDGGAKIAERGYHQSDTLRKLVREFGAEVPEPSHMPIEPEVHQVPNTATGKAAAGAIAAQGESDQASPQSVGHLISQSQGPQDQLTGKVHELTDADVLETITGYITRRFLRKRPLYITEPYQASVEPFITLPIPKELCLTFHNKRRRLM